MKVLILLTTLISTAALAGATRIIDADSITSSDKTKTFSLPSATDTLVGRDSTDTLTNKTISGSANTLSNVPMGSVSGTLAIANGGTGETTAQAAIDALVPDQTLQTGKVLGTDGTNVSWVTAGSGANTTLSNLTSPVAINQDLHPGTNNNRLFGLATQNWQEAYINILNIGRGSSTRMRFYGGGSLQRGEIQLTNVTTPDGNTGHLTLDTLPATAGNYNIALWSFSDSNLNANVTGEIFLETGNKTNASASGSTGRVAIATGDAAGSGNSGNIYMETGTVNTGTRGKVQIDALLVDTNSGIKPSKLTADPCTDTTAYPEGTLFYNDTSDYFCFCNGAGDDVQMHSPATACF